MAWWMILYIVGHFPFFNKKLLCTAFVKCLHYCYWELNECLNWGGRLPWDPTELRIRGLSLPFHWSQRERQAARLLWQCILCTCALSKSQESATSKYKYPMWGRGVGRAMGWNNWMETINSSLPKGSPYRYTWLYKFKWLNQVIKSTNKIKY